MCDPNSESGEQFFLFFYSFFPLDPWGEHHARINTGSIRDPYWVWLLSIDPPTLVREETLQAPLAAAALVHPSSLSCGS